MDDRNDLFELVPINFPFVLFLVFFDHFLQLLQIRPVLLYDVHISIHMFNIILVSNVEVVILLLYSF